MIHWQYIKGAYAESGTTNIPYTFMDFYGGNGFSSSTSEVTQDMLPQIYLAVDTNRTNLQPAGYIVTSDVPQSFTAKITFSGDANKGIAIGSQWKIVQENSKLAIKGSGSIARFSDGTSYLDTNIIGSGYFELNSYLKVNSYIRINNAFTSSPKTTAGDLSAKAIYSENICEAQYFNATSDRRAKTNIKPINQSVLPLVTNTQLYSFKYKDLDTPSIGIIAQDVQDVDFDGFSLVDNKEATGQDMDYMSIHESKLVYVLWKAIQEQQKEIEELKAQIKKGL